MLSRTLLLVGVDNYFKDASYLPSCFCSRTPLLFSKHFKSRLRKLLVLEVGISEKNAREYMSLRTDEGLYMLFMLLKSDADKPLAFMWFNKNINILLKSTSPRVDH